eukprot:gene21405-144_t
MINDTMAEFGLDAAPCVDAANRLEQGNTLDHVPLHLRCLAHILRLKCVIDWLEEEAMDAEEWDEDSWATHLHCFLTPTPLLSDMKAMQPALNELTT